MASSKLQLKAELFKILEPIRNINAIDDKIFNKTLRAIRKIKDIDYDFCSKILIKEVNPNNSKASTIFLLIAQNLSFENFSNFIAEELNSKEVSDEKKFFIINLMPSFGIDYMPDEIELYLKNPNKTVQNETLKFLDSAAINPEAQIDFLDFYYSSSEYDRKEILNTVFNDFNEEKVLNIITGLMLSIQNESIVLTCLGNIKKIKTPLLKRPLEYLKISNCPNISKEAAKIYRKLSMQGVFDREKIEEFYSKMFADFEEPQIYFSYPDGNSNSSVIISRKNKKGFFELLFIALNITLGPFSCFGFSSLTPDDYYIMLDRFFMTSPMVQVENSLGKTILFELTKKRISLNKLIPYEYYCWERCIEDIKICDMTYEEVLNSSPYLNIEKTKLDDFSKKYLLTSFYVKNWFYKTSKNNPEFSSFLDEIKKINKDKIYKIEDCLHKYSKNKALLSILKDRIKFLVFCLISDNKTELAKMYHSCLFDNSFLISLSSNILKRSVYEHYMKIKNTKYTNKLAQINTTENQNEDLFISYAKENWTVD